MLDRPIGSQEALSGPARRLLPGVLLAFVGIAGLLGASGVAVGAAGAHRGGGDLARTSSEFLLVHAAAIVAGACVAPALGRTSVLVVTALGLLAVGAALFGGELAVAALFDWRPVPLAAPTGGLCLIAGWLCLSVCAVVAGTRRR
jgi:uncharacterized membrane protein YgdD (TMEM256/DUF423 family)